MPDLAHVFGDDLQLSATGGLATADIGTGLVRQRILRRLLTNPGAYIFEPAYGAGLPSLIGKTPTAHQVQALVRSQIFQEAAVARVPEPTITVRFNPDGSFYLTIVYTDAASGTPQMLAFMVA